MQTLYLRFKFKNCNTFSVDGGLPRKKKMDETFHIKRYAHDVAYRSFFGVYLHPAKNYYIYISLLASACLCIFGPSLSNFLNYIVWLRITDEGSLPEMRIWSILLIKSD